MTKRFGISLLAMLFVLVASMTAFSQDAAKGKDLYAKKCASCHGPAGEGKESVAKMLKVELRHLGSKEVQDKNDAALKKDTVEGVGKMKGIKITDQEAADVVAFMRTLKK